MREMFLMIVSTIIARLFSEIEIYKLKQEIKSKDRDKEFLQTALSILIKKYVISDNESSEDNSNDKI